MLGLTPHHVALIERVDEIVSAGIAERAARYDATAEFPVEDFEDLGKANLLLATLPEKDGGLGYNFDGDDPLSFFLMIERIAMVSPATAHCFQTHSNAMQILRDQGTDEQVKRFSEPTRMESKLLVGSASEPGGGRHSSTALPRDGGFVLNGVKHYATNATHCTWMTVHMFNTTAQRMETLVVNTGSEGLKIDASVWDPSGMRACVSPLLTFQDCFVPEDCILRNSDTFYEEHWLAKINFGFTANYLGIIQGMYAFARDYLRDRGQKTNETYQSALGTISARTDAARLLFYYAASLIPTEREKALVLSNKAKWMAVETFNQLSSEVGQLIGSSGFFRKYPLERLVRDGQVHTLHRRHHVGAMVVGQYELGLEFDLNKS